MMSAKPSCRKCAIAASARVARARAVVITRSIIADAARDDKQTRLCAPPRRGTLEPPGAKDHRRTAEDAMRTLFTTEADRVRRLGACRVCGHRTRPIA